MTNISWLVRSRSSIEKLHLEFGVPNSTELSKALRVPSAGGTARECSTEARALAWPQAWVCEMWVLITRHFSFWVQFFLQQSCLWRRHWCVEGWLTPYQSSWPPLFVMRSMVQWIFFWYRLQFSLARLWRHRRCLEAWPHSWLSSRTRRRSKPRPTFNAPPRNPSAQMPHVYPIPNFVTWRLAYSMN